MPFDQPAEDAVLVIEEDNTTSVKAAQIGCEVNYETLIADIKSLNIDKPLQEIDVDLRLLHGRPLFFATGDDRCLDFLELGLDDPLRLLRLGQLGLRFRPDLLSDFQQRLETEFEFH